MSLANTIDINDSDQLLTNKKLVIPKKIMAESDWTLEALQEHLQWAVDIELFTIPFYMSAMYSIKDQASEARRLVRSVVNQEMLHMQSAANIANAYGTNLVISSPSYGGSIPHLDFALDEPNPTHIFKPFSTSIGPFDIERINAMCIVEFPEWGACVSKEPKDEYGSIGEFYDSVRKGTKVLANQIQGNRNQVGHFSEFYPDAQLTVTKAGVDGLPQVNSLINLIVDQGEGRGNKAPFIPRKYQNRVNDLQPSWDHFEKFTYLREQALPETYSIGPGDERGQETQQLLLKNFGEFLKIMNQIFRGEKAEGFATIMYTVGAGISACWEQGVVPVFSKPSNVEGGK